MQPKALASLTGGVGLSLLAADGHCAARYGVPSRVGLEWRLCWQYEDPPSVKEVAVFDAEFELLGDGSVVDPDGEEWNLNEVDTFSLEATGFALAAISGSARSGGEGDRAPCAAAVQRAGARGRTGGVAEGVGVGSARHHSAMELRVVTPRKITGEPYSGDRHARLEGEWGHGPTRHRAPDYQ